MDPAQQFHILNDKNFKETPMSQYMCAFCLEMTEAENTPDECLHCKVGSCSECGTFLKPPALPTKTVNLCYGCGTFKPKIRYRFARSGSLSSCYLIQEWEKRNFPKYSASGSYVIAHGWKNSEDRENGGKRSTYIAKRVGDDFVFERDLTEEEKSRL
jgi:hypothetical protein